MLEAPPFPRTRPLPRERVTRPREGTFRRPPLVGLGTGAHSFVGETDGCRMGWARHGRAVAWGRVALGRGGLPQGTLKLTYP